MSPQTRLRVGSLGVLAKAEKAAPDARTQLERQLAKTQTPAEGGDVPALVNGEQSRGN